jgi:DegV family protein with EDD domain
MSKSKKFIISTDTCVDLYKNYLIEKNVYCFAMKRVVNGTEISEHLDSAEKFDAFYETLKNGSLPITTAINPEEMNQYFKNIIENEKSGDIVHVCLSSGLSATCDNVRKAAEEINGTLDGRKIYVIDSLAGTLAMGWMIEDLIIMRDKGETTLDAIEKTEKTRDRIHIFAIMSDLYHLKRGGRIGAFTSIIGTILNIKPIVYVTKKGKLVVENKVRGNRKATDYMLGKMYELGETVDENFANSTVYIVRTTPSKQFDEIKQAVAQKYPALQIREGIVGPIIGTHLGCGTVLVIFQGAPRLDL